MSLNRFPDLHAEPLEGCWNIHFCWMLPRYDPETVQTPRFSPIVKYEGCNLIAGERFSLGVGEEELFSPTRVSCGSSGPEKPQALEL